VEKRPPMVRSSTMDKTIPGLLGHTVCTGGKLSSRDEEEEEEVEEGMTSII
jgi:hypothetical protein